MGKKKGKKTKKKKKEVIEDDEFTTMDGSTLEKTLANLKERLKDAKIKRNIIQIEKDMIHDFYSNSKNQIEEIGSEIKNYETKMETLEVEHKVEQKVYSQKVKHLEYQHKNDSENVVLGAEESQKKELHYHIETEKDLSKTKEENKKEYKEVEYAHINQVETENKQLNSKIVDLETSLDLKKKGLINQYEFKLKKLQEELDLRLKVEIHEIEERKNQHINHLMGNHEKAFRDMKDFYTDITRENLELIRIHREKLTEYNTKILENQKTVDDIKLQNERLKAPLAKMQKKRDDMRKATAGFVKTKLSLKNAKARMKDLRKKVKEMKVLKQELYEKYDKLERQKADMTFKFEVASEQLRMKSEYKNALLDEKLCQNQDEHTRKEVQLHELIQRSGLNPNTVDEICHKMKEAIEAKNSLLRNLKYSLAHATKAYNDAIRVYEAKLIEFGIPAEELGLELLETNTSTMPAGLVAA